MSGILPFVGNGLVVLGALIFATAALGLIRFPDVFTRISAVGTAGGIGIILVLTGALVLRPTISDAVKVVLIIGLHLATSAVGSMAIARSAYLSGSPLRRAQYNDLSDRDARRRGPGSND